MEDDINKPSDLHLIEGQWEGVAVADNASLPVRMHFNVVDAMVKATVGESLRGELRLWERVASVHMSRRSFQRPYRKEEITFKNKNATLTGTLLVPNTTGPQPAIVFVHGSGAQSRETYRGVADHFARHGLIALIYDKRGTGGSTGDWERADFSDLAQDTHAAIDYLKTREAVDSTRIGIYGFSQGGWIVSLVSNLVPDLAFIVMVSGAVVTPAQQVSYEMETRLRRNGFSESDISQAITLKRQFDRYTSFGENRSDLEAVLSHAKQQEWFVVAEDLPQLLPSFEDLAWWRSVMNFDPVKYWVNATSPILALWGENDAIVFAQQSAAILAGIKAETGKDITIRTFAKANHSLMVFPSPNELFRWFGFADGYMDALTTWVKERARITT